jgi:hypothetical protein
LEPNSGAAAAAEVLLPAFLQGSVDLASLRPEVALALQEARIILRAAQDRCTSVEWVVNQGQFSKILLTSDQSEPWQVLPDLMLLAVADNSW